MSANAVRSYLELGRSAIKIINSRRAVSSIVFDRSTISLLAIVPLAVIIPF